MTIFSKFFGTCGFRILSNNCYEIGHTWNPSCIGSSSQILVAAFKESLRVYASLYALAALLRTGSVKKIRWKRLIFDILRSTLFLTSNAFFFLYTLCLQRRLLGCWCYLNAGFTNGLIASFISIFIERKSRRGILALYMTNLASEVAFRMLVNGKYLTPFRHGETLIFSLALFGYMLLLKKNQLSSEMAKIFRFVFSIPERPTDEIQFFGYPVSSFPGPLRRAMNAIRRCFGKHPSCPHSHSCVSVALEGFMRNFPVTYLAGGVLRLATSLPNLAKNPGMVRKAFFSVSALKLPLFVGLLPLLFSSSTCLLRHLCGKDTSLIHGIGGFVAGLAMFSFPSASIAMYLLWKLLEVVYFKLAKRGILPRWKHFDILLYTLSTSFILFAACIQPHALRATYWKFLLRLTDNKLALVNRRLFNVLGFDSSRNFRDYNPVLDPMHTTVNPIFFRVPS